MKWLLIAACAIMSIALFLVGVIGWAMLWLGYQRGGVLVLISIGAAITTGFIWGKSERARP